MSRCYLIGWIDIASRQLVRLSFASTFPVSQRRLGIEHQALLAERAASSFQEAHDALVADLSTPPLSWLQELL